MSQVIKLKRSTTPNAEPTTLAIGELAVNLGDYPIRMWVGTSTGPQPLFEGTAVEDANDDAVYGRSNGEWVKIVSDGTNPIAGQFRRHTANGEFSFYDNGAWQTIGGAFVNNDPSGSFQGKIWWHTAQKNLQVYDGTQWRLTNLISFSGDAPYGADADLGTPWFDPVSNNFYIKTNRPEAQWGVWQLVNRSRVELDVPTYPMRRDAFRNPWTKLLQIYDGTEWLNIVGAIEVSATAPLNAVTGSPWLDSNNNFRIWNGGWQMINRPRIFTPENDPGSDYVRGDIYLDFPTFMTYENGGWISGVGGLRTINWAGEPIIGTYNRATQSWDENRLGAHIGNTSPAGWTFGRGDGWYNTDTRDYRVYDGSNWQLINRPRIFTTRPSPQVHGDVFFDGEWGGAQGLLDVWHAPYGQWRHFGGGISGQYWGNQFPYVQIFDRNNDVWRALSLGAVCWNSEPTFVRSPGSLWFNPDNNEFRAFDGSAWQLINRPAVPAGNNGTFQFNNNGAFAGLENFTVYFDQVRFKMGLWSFASPDTSSYGDLEIRFHDSFGIDSYRFAWPNGIFCLRPEHLNFGGTTKLGWSASLDPNYDVSQWIGRDASSSMEFNSSVDFTFKRGNDLIVSIKRVATNSYERWIEIGSNQYNTSKIGNDDDLNFRLVPAYAQNIFIETDYGRSVVLGCWDNYAWDFSNWHHGNIRAVYGGAPTGTYINLTAGSDKRSFEIAPAANLLLRNMPTSDPAVANAVWNDRGVIVFSGSAVPGGDPPVALSIPASPRNGDLLYFPFSHSGTNAKLLYVRENNAWVPLVPTSRGYPGALQFKDATDGLLTADSKLTWDSVNASLNIDGIINSDIIRVNGFITELKAPGQGWDDWPNNTLIQVGTSVTYFHVPPGGRFTFGIGDSIYLDIGPDYIRPGIPIPFDLGSGSRRFRDLLLSGIINLNDQIISTASNRLELAGNSGILLRSAGSAGPRRMCFMGYDVRMSNDVRFQWGNAADVFGSVNYCYLGRDDNDIYIHPVGNLQLRNGELQLSGTSQIRWMNDTWDDSLAGIRQQGNRHIFYGGGTQFNAGTNWGGFVTDPADLSRHINLNGGVFGLSVTAGFLNLVAASSGTVRTVSTSFVVSHPINPGTLSINISNENFVRYNCWWGTMHSFDVGGACKGFFSNDGFTINQNSALNFAQNAWGPPYAKMAVNAFGCVDLFTGPDELIVSVKRIATNQYERWIELGPGSIWRTAKIGIDDDCNFRLISVEAQNLYVEVDYARSVLIGCPGNFALDFSNWRHGNLYGLAYGTYRGHINLTAGAAQNDIRIESAGGITMNLTGNNVAYVGNPNRHLGLETMHGCLWGILSDQRISSVNLIANSGNDLEMKAPRHIILRDLPTSNPGVPDVIWNDNGTLRIS